MNGADLDPEEVADPVRFRVLLKATGILLAHGCSFAHPGGGAALTRHHKGGPVEFYESEEKAIAHIERETVGAVVVEWLDDTEEEAGDEPDGEGHPHPDISGDGECTMCGDEIGDDVPPINKAVEIDACRSCADRMNDKTPAEDYRE